jgi:hypothetical protein
MTEVVIHTMEYYTELYKNKKTVELKKMLASSRDEFWSYNGRTGMGNRRIDLLHKIISIDDILEERGD